MACIEPSPGFCHFPAESLGWCLPFFILIWGGRVPGPVEAPLVERRIRLSSLRLTRVGLRDALFPQRVGWALQSAIYWDKQATRVG